MNLEEMMKQQQSKGFKQNKIKAKMQSFEDYVRDDSSPRPYNTANVSDLSIKTDTITPIRDTKGNAAAPSIRDTKSTDSAFLIRDTKSIDAAPPIRDTKSIDAAPPIRDTKSIDADSPIRDTKGIDAAPPIRDTKSIDATPPISDKKSIDAAPHIRDTKSINTASPIRDIKGIDAASPIRDIKGIDAASPIRDTTSIDAAPHIRDTKSIDAAPPIRDTKSINTASPIRDTKSIDTAPPIRDTKSSDIAASTNAALDQRGVGRPLKGDTYGYTDLHGNSKKIIDEIVRRCMISGDLCTGYIEKKKFALSANVKEGAIKTTVWRLKEKKVILEFEATKGRNSSWKFTISSKIYEEWKCKKQSYF